MRISATKLTYSTLAAARLNVRRIVTLGVVLSVSASALSAQQPATEGVGRVTGRVVDSKTGEPLTDIQVQVEGQSKLGTMSGIDGRYTIFRVPAGTITIRAQRIGFQAKIVTGIFVPANGVIEQDISMLTASVTLAAISVTAAVERGSVNKALDEQRSSNAILNSTTSEQIRKSPDGDAASAIKRVSGVTLQDGKYPQVRGLGERYTQTSLNGARVPSPDPERKLVPLDMFPSGLLDAITTSKTFTPDLPGDFSGALVDIRTKEFPARKAFGLSISSGANGLATGSSVLGAATTGGEWIGSAGSARSMPQAVRNAGDLKSVKPGAETNALLRSFRNSWAPTRGNGRANGSTGLSYGGEDRVLGMRFGYVGSLSYSASQEVRKNETLNVPQADGKGGAIASSSFNGESGNSSVLWGGLLNLSTWFGPKSRLTIANTYNRTSDNEAQQLSGKSEEFGAMQTSRLSFIQRSVLANQLRGEHMLGNRNSVNWSLSRSQVTRDEPDRADLNYWTVGGGLNWKGGSNDATRTFSSLDETDYAGALNYRVLLGDISANRVLKIGAFSRKLERTSDVRAYDIINLKLDYAQLKLPAEQLFDGRYATGADTNFLISPSSYGGAYTASERLSAGYAMLEWSLSDRLKLITGARVENANITVDSRAPQGSLSSSKLNNTDVLPSAAVMYTLTSAQNLRFSASQTLSRPEYRELSPIAYISIGGRNEERGNPDLKRALVQNYDIRWERYPSVGEVMSIGLFAKTFHDPIERVFQATTGKPQIGFANASSATNYGVEFDVRKNLGFAADALSPITVFSNVTMMKSQIHITSTTTAATNPDRAMVGQAPFVVNAGVSYSNYSGKVNATLLYNVVGKRITIAGVQPLPDTYEQARNVVDFALQVPIAGSISARLTAQNLLDAKYQERTGDLIRREYSTGRIIGVGLSFKP